MVEIVVSESGASVTIGSSYYLYDYDNTPEVTSVTPNILSVSG